MSLTNHPTPASQHSLFVLFIIAYTLSVMKRLNRTKQKLFLCVKMAPEDRLVMEVKRFKKMLVLSAPTPKERYPGRIKGRQLNLEEPSSVPQTISCAVMHV